MEPKTKSQAAFELSARTAESVQSLGAAVVALGEGFEALRRENAELRAKVEVLEAQEIPGTATLEVVGRSDDRQFPGW